MFFLFFTRTESPGTTGNRVNQVTERKVNIGKVKEDLNPFSSFLRLDKDPANTENHKKPYLYVLCPDFNVSFLIIETLVIPPHQKEQSIIDVNSVFWKTQLCSLCESIHPKRFPSGVLIGTGKQKLVATCGGVVAWCLPQASSLKQH